MALKCCWLLYRWLQLFTVGARNNASLSENSVPARRDPSRPSWWCCYYRETFQKPTTPHHNRNGRETGQRTSGRQIRRVLGFNSGTWYIHDLLIILCSDSYKCGRYFVKTIIIIYFENVHFFHAVLGLDICPYEVPLHIPEYCSFTLQTKQFHVIIHTFFPVM